MNILHVYKDYAPVIGGIENHIQALGEAQQAAGHQVTVLVTNPGHEPARERINGVQVLRVRRLATLASTPLSPGFPLALGRQSPDITHLHYPYPIGELSQLLAGGGRPYIVTYHSDVVSVRQQAILRLYHPLLIRFLRQAANILATSSAYITSSPYLRPLADKCELIPLGVDARPFLSAPPLLPPEDLPTLLFVGRHRYYKGVDVLLKAMPNLGARLLVAGDGPMRAGWEQMASSLGVSARVRFLGDVPAKDLPGLYASADVFILPATMRAEAFGTVLLEAMAAGLPCVTTELGTGTSFVVQDGVTGLVVPPADVEALARAVRRLVEDVNLRETMGTSGQARVRAEFSLERMVNRVEAVYERAVEAAEQPSGVSLDPDQERVG